MSLRDMGEFANTTARTNETKDTADRIFIALREETRAHQITNDDVKGLLNLADALAEALVHDAPCTCTREKHVVARARAALDAHHAAAGDLHKAIACVRARMEELMR
jgi:hypothetical protein